MKNSHFLFVVLLVVNLVSCSGNDDFYDNFPEGKNILDYIPDKAFKERLVNNVFGGQTFVTKKDAEEVKWIEVPKILYINEVGDLTPITENIVSLEGIQFFTNLTTLICNGNEIKHLDLSKNSKLTLLNCGCNKLTSLDISNNVELSKLYSWDNQFNFLDISKNTKLKEINCGVNKLKSLDVSYNTKLSSLICNDNKIKSLDVSKNITLKVLVCKDNPLESIAKSVKISRDGYNLLSNSIYSYLLPDKTSHIYYIID